MRFFTLFSKTDQPHLFTVRVVKHCAAISATVYSWDFVFYGQCWTVLVWFWLTKLAGYILLLLIVRLISFNTHVHKIIIIKNKEIKKSHIFAQTTHIALPPPKLSCGVGSQT